VPNSESSLRWYTSRLVLLVAAHSVMSAARLAGLAILVIVVLCMVYHRGGWPIWKRVFFVLLAWGAASILADMLSFWLVGPLLVELGKPHLVRTVANYIATTPIIIYAVRQSSLFVGQEDLTDVQS